MLPTPPGSRVFQQVQNAGIPGDLGGGREAAQPQHCRLSSRPYLSAPLQAPLRSPSSLSTTLSTSRHLSQKGEKNSHLMKTLFFCNNLGLIPILSLLIQKTGGPKRSVFPKRISIEHQNCQMLLLHERKSSVGPGLAKGQKFVFCRICQNLQGVPQLCESLKGGHPKQCFSNSLDWGALSGRCK